MIVDDWKPKYKKPKLWKYIFVLLCVFIIISMLVYEKQKWINQLQTKPNTKHQGNLLNDANIEQVKVQTNIDEQVIKNAHIENSSQTINNHIINNQTISNQTDNSQTISNQTINTPTKPFSIEFKNNDNLQLETSESFNFKKDDSNFITPLPKALKNNLILLKKHLSNDPSHRLNITGLYITSENNHSIFPNMGLARANQIKKYLLSLGFNSKQINLNAQTKDATPNDDVFDGMVDFSVDTLTSDALLANQIAIEKLKHSIKAQPLILKFAEGEAHIGMTPEKREKILNIMSYVDKVKGSKLILTGHTDSLGQDKDNMLLAKKRATFVADFLAENGLDRRKMKIVTRGEAEPIASNATDEGRAKNRRTVVTIE